MPGEVSAAERPAALARTLRPFLGFVDTQWATIHLKAVQGLNGGLCFTLRHIDETEAARLSSFAVIDELDRIDLAVTLEEASDVLLCGVEGEIPYVDRRHPITRLQKADSGEPHESVA
jgi:hypothetical protein